MLDRAALAVAKIWGIILQQSPRAFDTVPLKSDIYYIHPWFVVCRLEHQGVFSFINKQKLNS